MKLESGQQVEQYTVTHPLGHGGMSDVFLARDEAHERDVVLKFPHSDIMGDPKTYEHFRREIKIGQILTHPNIQKLYSLGGEQDAPFLVLEYVPGRTLRDILNETEDEPRSAKHVAYAVSIGQQVATALAYAHENHIAHRDLKPENVIVTPDGHAKVMDFGIAYVEGARRVTWGALSTQVGTPDYMAPEQIKGLRGDHRTDIYALGMILYECIAGRVAYQGDNALAVMNQHVMMKPPPIHDFYHGVPPAIDEVVLKAIRRDPAARWQSMSALAAALEHPDTVDVAALKAEREAEAGETVHTPGFLSELNRPLWQVLLIVGFIFVSIIALGVIAQLIHKSPG